ncbi:hypothetical protein INR49_025235 [Caranx melampygus]|nr:hypothetical protein INR49_025235 [Caranx melampygus]
MTFRLFEGKDHASIYQKYRFTPPDELKKIILQYLDKKKGQPHVLAVDLGCGTGQNSRLLAPHFSEVVGIDVSPSQLEEARAVPGYSNITYRFLAEASRVLKPRGCIALLGYSDRGTRFHYQNCGECLSHIYEEVKQLLSPFTSSPVAVADGKLEELYSAIPFPEKERIESIPVKSFISVRNVMGFVESWSMFQTYRKADPQNSHELLLNTQKRFLKEMGVSSPDTEIEWELEYFCVLASKPQ